MITPYSGEISNLCLPRTFFSSLDISAALSGTLFRKLGFGDSLFKREIKRGNHDWSSCSELGNAQNGGNCPDLVFKLETVGKWVEISEQSERFELREKREEVPQRKREKERPQVHSGIQFSFFGKSDFY